MLSIQKNLKTVAFTLVFLLVLSIMFYFLAFPKAPGNPSGFSEITNSHYGFTIDYPSNWTAKVYGESGYRGAKDIKLRIYSSETGVFRIAIYARRIPGQDVSDVASWGESRINQINQKAFLNREEPVIEVQKIDDVINGMNVIRRVYGDSKITYEDVYIAREQDLIIIQLRAPSVSFDEYQSDFIKIIESFNPQK